MMLITKELALAVVNAHCEGNNCVHCGRNTCDDGGPKYILPNTHEPDCIVPKAKLLLKLEWGIES